MNAAGVILATSLALASLAMKHEEPLVKITLGKSNRLAVSPVVNTKAFRDAFEAMPLPKPVKDSAYKQAGRILNLTNGTEFEYLVAISARTGILIVDNLNAPCESTYKTGFYRSDLARIDAQEDKVVLIHNHPRSYQPSYRDVLTATQYEAIRASIVVGHDGSVWYFSVSDSSIAARLEESYNLLKCSLGDAAETAALIRLLKVENGKSIDWRQLR